MTLADTLALSTVNGYTPALGDTLGILTCGACSGQFATVTGTSIGGAKHFAVIYSASGVSVNVASGG